MIVKCRKPQIDYFRRKARSSGNEIMALLVGKLKRVGEVHITQFVYPALQSSTPSGVWVDDKDWCAERTKAEAQGLQIIGTIHNHPNWAPVMSPADFVLHKSGGIIVTGIVEVTNGRTRVCFWQDGSPLPCTLAYF